MADLNCERTRIAAMAVEDGCAPELSAEEIETHLAACNECRSDVERMQSLMKLLDAQERREIQASLWNGIEQRIEQKGKTSRRVWEAILLAALLLLGCKVTELASTRDMGLSLKVATVLIAIAVFAYLKENPFKINLELKSEGE